MADEARNVAVLIDYENLNDTKSLKKVLAHGGELGRVVVKRAVGDFSANGDKPQSKLRELGILPVQQATAGKGTNSSDMRMAIEAIDLFHDRDRSIDVYVLASCDADFLPLAQWLRASGKHVVGVGRSDASELWQQGVDEFVVVKTVNAAAKVTKASSASKPKSAQSAKASQSATNGKAATPNVLNPKYKEVIETAINQVFGNGATEVASDTLLKRIMKIEPQFSCRKAGFTRFRKLVESFDQVSIPADSGRGKFVIRKRGS